MPPDRFAVPARATLACTDYRIACARRNGEVVGYAVARRGELGSCGRRELMIADWIVQSKIQNAASACERTVSQVTSAISICRRRLTEAREQQQDVAEQRRTLIEQA